MAPDFGFSVRENRAALEAVTALRAQAWPQEATTLCRKVGLIFPELLLSQVKLKI